jgi:hypothetical protein
MKRNAVVAAVLPGVLAAGRSTEARGPTLTFDGQAPFNVQRVAVGDMLVRVPMPPIPRSSASSAKPQFRKARAMMAYAQGQLFRFSHRHTERS